MLHLLEQILDTQAYALKLKFSSREVRLVHTDHHELGDPPQGRLLARGSYAKCVSTLRLRRSGRGPEATGEPPGPAHLRN